MKMVQTGRTGQSQTNGPMATRRPFITGKKLFGSCLRTYSKTQFRLQSLTGNKPTDDLLLKATGGRIVQWWEYVSNVTGLSEVKRAQDVVLQAEVVFQAKQEERRNQSRELSKLQSHLHEITKDRETTQRGTELFLKLVTKENNIIKEENELKEKIQVLEEEERNSFSKMSSALRASQEIERSQARQSQQVSLLLSLVGGMIGVIITTFVNHYRMKKMNAIVLSSSETVADYQVTTAQLREHVKCQEEKMSELINLHHKAFGDKPNMSGEQSAPVHSSLSDKTTNVEQCTKEILQVVKNQEQVLDKEIADMKALLGMNKAKQHGDNVVYVGPEVQTMLDSTQQNLEWKIKMSALASSVFVYGGIVLTLPVVYFLFKGTGGS